ncbi:MAG: hypothetical protein AAF518_03825 [Spirochaetota bacterium]
MNTPEETNQVEDVPDNLIEVEETPTEAVEEELLDKSPEDTVTEVPSEQEAKSEEIAEESQDSSVAELDEQQVPDYLQKELGVETVEQVIDLYKDLQAQISHLQAELTDAIFIDGGNLSISGAKRIDIVKD